MQPPYRAAARLRSVLRRCCAGSVTAGRALDVGGFYVSRLGIIGFYGRGASDRRTWDTRDIATSL